jgi:hypothetical protein
LSKRESKTVYSGRVSRIHEANAATTSLIGHHHGVTISKKLRADLGHEHGFNRLIL